MRFSDKFFIFFLRHVSFYLSAQAQVYHSSEMVILLVQENWAKP